MSFKQIAGATLIATLAAGSAFAQTGDVRGWTPRAPGGAGAGAGGGAGVTPPPPGGNDGPRSISRGEGQTPPAPPAVGGGNAPPTGGGGAVAGGGGGGAAPGGTGAGYTFLTAVDPAVVAQAMQNAGYRAELSTDDDGNPKLIGSASRSTYWVYFLDCQLSIGCAGIEFYVSYDQSYAPSMEQINTFNNDYRYIRASIDSWGRPTMYMDIIMRDGGISEEAFQQYLRLWHLLVPEFETIIGF